VIDEKMKDEMRITVIATGFGRADSREERVPEAATFSPERERVVVDFARKEENREIPAFLRSEKPKEVQERIARAARGRVSSNLGVEDEYDIPTFLRKQAD
jgi:cell division GTPase FtsZ